MHYVDGYVLSVPEKNMEAYRKIAQKAGEIWKEHGALEYRECVGEHLNPEMGVHFPKQMNSQPGETVVFAWIVFESREHRDQVNAKVLADPRMKESMGDEPMPFDCSRMVYGGFKTIVDIT